MLAQAGELLDWYRVRREIELLFLILKEGCRVEALQLEDVNRIETVLALHLVWPGVSTADAHGPDRDAVAGGCAIA